MQPSVHQQTVIDHVRSGNGHIMVEAVAGSGKTSLLTMVAQTLKSGVAVCFGREAKAELGRRFETAGVTGVEALTVHSLGFAALRHEFDKIEVDDSKYFNEAKRLLTAAKVQYKDLSPKQLKDMFDLLRVNMLPLDPESWTLTVLEHGLSIDYDSVRGAAFCSELAHFGKTNKKVVDFTDMIWLPGELGIRGKKYDWLLVDEAQDISRLQYSLIRQAMSKNGRALFVGDRRQAIYHFAGADAASFTNITQDLGAQLLPLSVCYRCPTSVLELARKHCPQIEARSDADHGVVRQIKVDDLGHELQESDMVLCRYTAPLITLCYSLIAQGKSATVRGRNIGQGLITMIKKVCGDDLSMTIDSLRQGFVALLVKEERKAQALTNEIDRDRVLATLADKCECLTAVLQSCDGSTAGAVIQSINKLFSDASAAIVCSTVHRAKGLEADRVFLFWPCMSERATSHVQREQERHIEYVAVTRARKELVLVTADGEGISKPIRRRAKVQDMESSVIMDE